MAGWNKTSNLPFINASFMQRIGEILSAVLIIHGEKVHSLYMGKTAFSKLKGGKKDMLIIPGANHTDLYDGGTNHYFSFDKLAVFYNKYLK